MKFNSFQLFLIVFACGLFEKVSCGRGLNYGHYITTASSKTCIEPFDSTATQSSNKWKSLKGGIGQTVEKVCTGSVQKGPKVIHRLLFVLTATDALQAVVMNKYGKWSDSDKQNYGAKLLRLASRLFVRPRLMYVVGALLRALQLSTPLHMIIDPSIGVGAGINLCALLARSRWLKSLVLGWATTKCFWKWMGATNVNQTSVPITLSIRDFGLVKKDS